MTHNDYKKQLEELLKEHNALDVYYNQLKKSPMNKQLNVRTFFIVVDPGLWIDQSFTWSHVKFNNDSQIPANTQWLQLNSKWRVKLSRLKKRQPLNLYKT